MNARLAFAMIQRQRKGVTPPCAITAPLLERRDHTTEADRLAQFERSAKCVGGKHPDPFQPLSDGPLRLAPAPAGSPKPATIRNTAEVATQNTLVTAINTGEQVQDAGSTEEAA